MPKNIKRTVTRKKMKVFGTETYLNTQTGVLEEVQTIRIEDRDANFHKIWLHHLVMSLDIIGNTKMKFVFWLLDQMRADNLIPMTYEQMTKRSGYSYETIKRTMPLLIESGFLLRINQGVYQVNPDVIFKGGTENRFNILLQYRKQAEENDLTDETAPEMSEILDNEELQEQEF